MFNWKPTISPIQIEGVDTNDALMLQLILMIAIKAGMKPEEIAANVFSEDIRNYASRVEEELRKLLDKSVDEAINTLTKEE
jgi:hypothetical protein